VNGPSKADNAEPHGAERASATTAAHGEDPPFVAALVFEQLGLTANSLAVNAAGRLIRQTIGPRASPASSPSIVPSIRSCPTPTT
jgi:hypothetical protein